ncbi:MAG: hypothetical protein NVS3B21_24320 [Acidimicrobiales bacterium]
MVFADPGLVISQLIEAHEQLQISLQSKRGVLPHGVEGRKEEAELQALARRGGGHEPVCAALDRPVK